MKSRKEAEYRLKLAEGLLKEAMQDFAIKRWRSCVSNAQQALGNSAKAVIAYFGPLEKTHNTDKQLNLLFEKGLVDKKLEKD